MELEESAQKKNTRTAGSGPGGRSSRWQIQVEILSMNRTRCARNARPKARRFGAQAQVAKKMPSCHVFLNVASLRRPEAVLNSLKTLNIHRVMLMCVSLEHPTASVVGIPRAGGKSTGAHAKPPQAMLHLQPLDLEWLIADWQSFLSSKCLTIHS